MEQALKGILEQKVNFEFDIVVADDGSTDRTREIILTYSNKYPDKFKLIFQEKNVGAVQNWKDLLAFPKSKYIAYLEGDDYWNNPNKLQAQFDFLEQNEDVVIHCGHSIINSPNAEINERKVHPQFTDPQKLSYLDFALDSFVVSSTAMFRNLGYTTLPKMFDKATGGDWLFWIYIMHITKGFCYYSNEIFGVYRIHGNSAFSSLNTFKTYKFYILNMEIQKKYFENTIKKEAVIKKINWYKTELIRELLKEGKKNEARKYCWKELVLKNEIKLASQLFKESFQNNS